MRKVLVNGVNLHYEQQGTGSDVILVHGIANNLSYWLLTIMHGLSKHHRVTIFDLRGHGLSELTPTGYTTGDLADDLRGLMDGLGIERAHLYGHSHGGAIAMHCAVRYPERVRSLALGDSAIPALREHMSLANWPGYAKLQKWLGPYGVKLPDNPDTWDASEFLPQVYKLPTFIGMRRGLPLQGRRIQRLGDETTCFEDMRVVGDLTEERIRRMAVPTLAIYDEGGAFLSVGHYLAEHLPRCRLLVQEGNHLFPAVAPEALVTPLLAHFAAVDSELDLVRPRAGPESP
jgi:pimeloyl-ACP methyl ester carboxylesterase